MSNQQPISTFLGIAAAVVLVSSSHAAIINVPGDFGTIQAAIADPDTVPGDEIVVAMGVYPEVIDFLGKAITVRSSDGPEVTTIDGTGLNDSVVRCDNGEGPDTVLEGFTITGGTGDDFGNHTHGGGMTIRSNSSPTVINCRFTDNLNTGSIGGGGGIFVEASSPTVINCTFSGNVVLGEGGGMHLFSNSSAEVINCTFSGNTAGTAGSLWSDTSSTATLTNCILWDGINEIVGIGITVSYSDVQGGGFSGIGNINANPLFVDADNGNFRLSPGSPCIDAGDNSAVPGDVTTDLDGNPRFVDDPDTPDCQQVPGLPCPTDINGDRVTNVLDLIQLLLCFGQAATPGCEAEDINEDGTVNVLDLVQLLLQFGTACLPCGSPPVVDMGAYELPPPPINNSCVDRIAILAGLTAFDTTSATTDGLATNGTGDCDTFGGPQIHNDIWFNYTAPAAATTLVVATCPGEGTGGSSGYDTKIAIYDGCSTLSCPLGGTEIACNDDDLFNGCAATFEATVIAPVVGGNCYKIRVGGFGPGDSGTATLSVHN